MLKLIGTVLTLTLTIHNIANASRILLHTWLPPGEGDEDHFGRVAGRELMPTGGLGAFGGVGLGAVDYK